MRNRNTCFPPEWARTEGEGGAGTSRGSLESRGLKNVQRRVCERSLRNWSVFRRRCMRSGQVSEALVSIVRTGVDTHTHTQTHKSDLKTVSTKCDRFSATTTNAHVFLYQHNQQLALFIHWVLLIRTFVLYMKSELERMKKVEKSNIIRHYWILLCSNCSRWS